MRLYEAQSTFKHGPAKHVGSSKGILLCLATSMLVACRLFPSFSLASRALSRCSWQMFSKKSHFYCRCVYCMHVYASHILYYLHVYQLSHFASMFPCSQAINSVVFPMHRDQEVARTRATTVSCHVTRS